MLLYGFFALIGLAVLMTFANWRHGLYWFVIIGLLQDPVRKLVPGTPGYLVLATTPVWIAIVLKMSMSRPRRIGRLRDFHPSLVTMTMLFILSLVPAALISATYGAGSWLLTLLGAFTYGSLLYSVLIGYRFTHEVQKIRGFLGFYCCCAALLLSGTLLEYFDVPFPALGTAMLGFEWIRHIPGTIVHMVAGFFRSPDIMGWHAATLALLALTLTLSGRGGGRWFWLVLAIWGALLAVLCGRRKMVYMLPFFIIAVTWLHWWLRGQIRSVSVVAILLVTFGGVVFLYNQVEPDKAFMTYYTHNPSDVYAQVERHGLDSVIGTVQQSGFFGEGLGSASTGAHHLKVERPRVWQESGPSKVMVELGVPGFVCFVLLALSLLVSLWRMFRRRLAPGSRNFSLWAGLFAMILANAGAFVVSGQIFGDPFITGLLAIFIGFVLAAARLDKERQSVAAGQG